MSREICYLKRKRGSSINIMTAYELDDGGDWISGGGQGVSVLHTSRSVLWCTHVL
jgi:hypothetical protein